MGVRRPAASTDMLAALPTSPAGGMMWHRVSAWWRQLFHRDGLSTFSTSLPEFSITGALSLRRGSEE